MTALNSTGRDLRSGDLVRITKSRGVTWEVVSVETYDWGHHVKLCSTTSGCVRSAAGRQLFWAETGDRVYDLPSQAPEKTQHEGRFVFNKCGAVHLDGKLVRGSDCLTASVVEWDSPAFADRGPSSVSIGTSRDATGRITLNVQADGPHGDSAFLTRAKALELAAHILTIASGMSEG